MSSLTTSNFDGLGPYVNERKITCIAGEALKAGQLVEITADWTVKASTLTTTPSVKVAGVCLTDAASGAEVTVIAFGWLIRVTAYGTVTAGDIVAAGPPCDATKGLGGTVQTITIGTGTDMTTSAAIAAVISKAYGAVGRALVGASSGGSAYIIFF